MTETGKPVRGRPRKKASREDLEKLVVSITQDIGAIVMLFEQPDSGAISAAERIGTFLHLANVFEFAKARCASVHETAVLRAGTFSLADAAALAKVPQAPASIAAQTPNGATSKSALPTSPGRPDGFIPLEERKPHLAYDEVTGRAIGRKPRTTAPAPAGPQLVPDKEAGFMSAGDDKTNPFKD